MLYQPSIHSNTARWSPARVGHHPLPPRGPSSRRVRVRPSPTRRSEAVRYDRARGVEGQGASWAVRWHDRVLSAPGTKGSAGVGGSIGGSGSRGRRFDRSPCAAVAIVPRRAAETPMLLRRPGIEPSPVGCRSRTVGRSTPRRRPPHLPTSLLHRERRLRLRAHSASRRRWGRTGSGRTPPPTHLQLASRCSGRGRPHAVQRAQ